MTCHTNSRKKHSIDLHSVTTVDHCCMDCIDKDSNVKVQLKVNLSVNMSLRQTDCGALQHWKSARL